MAEIRNFPTSYPHPLPSGKRTIYFSWLYFYCVFFFFTFLFPVFLLVRSQEISEKNIINVIHWSEQNYSKRAFFQFLLDWRGCNCSVDCWILITEHARRTPWTHVDFLSFFVSWPFFLFSFLFSFFRFWYNLYLHFYPPLSFSPLLFPSLFLLIPLYFLLFYFVLIFSFPQSSLPF